MKKLMVFVILMVAMSINAQVQIYRAVVAEMTITEDWDDAEYTDVSDQGILIVFDVEKETIEITNSFQDKFVIMESKTIHDDTNGHVLTSYFFRCMDADGIKCTVVYSYFADNYKFGDSYSYRIRAAYANIWYGYYCNIAIKNTPQTPTPQKSTPKTRTTKNKKLENSNTCGNGAS